ncbi:MAG: hypothetical protein IJI41_05415 [Anaerolineaceae bacterium]|nr:hypothetical protein [Anaerolineaceae bacterium]
MTPLASIILLILSLIGCMIFKLDLVYGLLIGMFAFMAAAVHSGHSLRAVLRMMWSGIRESFIVVGVLLIIGAMTGIWRGSGTIQQLVVYGTELIHPKLFILFAFLLPAAVSYLIGTSFGTSASIGVVMMTLCRVSGADPVLTAGAIMSGIFVGDRASPASSCAHLNAYLTGTEIYSNVKRMLKDAIPATLITICAYTALSILNPVQTVETHIIDNLRSDYQLTPMLLIPALIILAAPLVKLNIKPAMGISILCASILSVTIQKMEWGELLRTLILGYQAKGELAEILSGGGLRSMAHGCLMIVISATYSGIFNGTNMLLPAEKHLEKLSSRMSLFTITALTGIPLIMFSCNQTLALMLHVPLLRPLYQKKGLSKEQLMLDMSNTTVLFSALVPWCLACSMPLEMLGASPACIPFAFFLYLPAVVNVTRGRFFCHIR